MGRDPPFQAFPPFPVAEHAEVGLRQVDGAAVHDLPDLVALLLGGQPHPGPHALRDGGVAAGAGEDERDGRQQARTVEPFDDVDAGRRAPSRTAAVRVGLDARSAAATRPGPAGEPVGGGLRVMDGPGQGRVDAQPRRRRIAGCRVGPPEQIEEPAADQHVLPQRHRTDLIDNHGELAANLGQPRPEFLGVRHGGRQPDDLNVCGQVQDHLFPHGPAELVGEVMDLVHHHVGQPGQVGRAGVQHVAEHLGGHHHNRGVRIDRGVTGEQPDSVRTVLGDEIGELLIGQRLDRGGVEAFTTDGQRLMDGKFPDDGLPGAGGSADQYAVTVLERPARVDLELIQGERPGQGEFGQVRVTPAVHRVGETLRRGHVRFAGPTVSCHQTRVAQAWSAAPVRIPAPPDRCRYAIAVGWALTPVDGRVGDRDVSGERTTAEKAAAPHTAR